MLSFSVRALAFCGAWCCSVSWAQMSGNPLEALSDKPRMDPYSYAKDKTGVGGAAVEACRKSSLQASKTGNSVVDMRCALVAFEVCMHKANGVVSQSQDSGKQCKIIQGLGGPGACAVPCAEAAQLPVGGNGVVTTAGGRYTGLTQFAVDCYQDTLSKPGINHDAACVRSEALQCLMNGSSSPQVNAAIRRERTEACAIMHRNSPNAICVACAGAVPRVDYAPGKIDMDARHCTPELAAQKLCAMDRSTGELPR